MQCFFLVAQDNCPTVGERLEYIHKMDHNITFIIDI